MATVSKISGLIVAMQSAIAAIKTITGITLAAPGVVTSASHGYSNGDYIYLLIQGTYQLNERVFRVCNVAADTFQLEGYSGGTGIDTSAYGVFSSGTAQKITFGTTIDSMTKFDIPNVPAESIDVTTVHHTQRVTVPGLLGETKADVEFLWDPGDAAQAALKLASDAQAKRAFKIQYGTGGRIMVFAGAVAFNGAAMGETQGVAKTSGQITSQGTPTYYSA